MLTPVNQTHTHNIMKLETGKYYTTRDGRKLRVIYTEAPGGRPVVTIDPSGYVMRHTADGRRIAGPPHPDNQHPGDIVGPWVEKPVFDRSLLSAWCRRAIAQDENGTWFAYDDVPVPVRDGWQPRAQSRWEGIPREFAPKWEGNWRDSLVVWEDAK